MNTKLEWRLVKVVDCPSAVLTGCYNLLRKHFDGVSYESFLSDLGEKEYIAYLSVSDADGETIGVGGFSTMMTKEIIVDGTTQRIVFSGDTVVDHEYRRSFGLGKCLGTYFLLKLKESAESLWYVLLSKGCGTYRAMDFMFSEFTPSPSDHNEVNASIAIQFLAEKYPSREILDRVVLRAEGDAQRLRGASSDLAADSDTLGQFFLDTNPGYANGDELICIARVHPDNFTKRFKRVLKGVEI